MLATVIFQRIYISHKRGVAAFLLCIKITAAEYYNIGVKNKTFTHNVLCILAYITYRFYRKALFFGIVLNKITYMLVVTGYYNLL